MKKLAIICFLILQLSIINCQISIAQCSVCTKTAQQMGEKPARGLNNAIMYLAAIPFLVAGTIGYRWWKSNRF